MPEPQHEASHNGVVFKVNDIKALLALVFIRTLTKGQSLRPHLEENATGTAHDSYGRPTKGECRDTNAGTYHVLLTNYLGIQRQSLISDRTSDNQVWSQPVRGYRITKHHEVSIAEAKGLVGQSSLGGEDVGGSKRETSLYQFNPSATRFFHMGISVNYIGESDASTDGHLAEIVDEYTHSDHYEYVLELDADGTIIGGEWVSQSEEAHPDFLWLPINHSDSSVAGGRITYANVKLLLDRSLDPG